MSLGERFTVRRVAGSDVVRYPSSGQAGWPLFSECRLSPRGAGDMSAVSGCAVASGRDDDPNAGLPAQDAVATVGGPFGRQTVDEAAVPAAEALYWTALVGAGQVRVPQQLRRGFGRPAGQVRP